MRKFILTAAVILTAALFNVTATDQASAAEAAGYAQLPHLQSLLGTHVQKAHAYTRCRYGHSHWKVQQSYRCCKRWGYRYGERYCRRWGTCYKDVWKWGCKRGGGGGHY